MLDRRNASIHSTSNKRIKVGIIANHPTQYEGPLYRKLYNDEGLELQVYYQSFLGVSGECDKEMDIEVKWDVPVLSGYPYTFIKDCGILGFFRLLIKDKLDCLIIHGYRNWSSIVALCSSSLSRRPVIHIGDSILIYPTPLFKKIVKRIAFPLLFKAMDAFLAVGSLSRQFFMYYGVPDEKIFLFPYAVDNDFFEKHVEGLRARKDEMKMGLGLPEDIPTILSVLKFIDRERPLDLLEAYKLLTKGMSAALVLVGDGPQNELIRKYIEENELEYVRLPGYVKYSELRDFYSIADVFVHPGIFECWGLSVNEAMASGLPIITSDLVGSSYDLIRNGENGYIYPAKDVEALAFYLESVISNLDLAKEMGRVSKTIIHSWSYDECIEGIIEAINYCLD